MKKSLLSLFVALVAMTVGLQAQTVYFSDGFENGLDAAWTQEYFDAASGQWVTETPTVSQPWKAESTAAGALEYPKGAAVGAGRAYFRQEAAAGKNVQTTGYRTRLITPKMNLSGYQPILRFYHAQAKWTADFDTLRVYYRQGAGTQWELLREYTSYIQKWTFEEMDLPRTGDDYQIAFEANENMGRGIVLDSVIIRTKPQITTPHDMAFYDMRDNGINLTWEASKDADAFRVIVAERDLDLNVYPSNLDSTKYIVMDTIITSDQKQDVRVENLAGGRTYYMQVQSIGEFENSVWSETFSFRMKPTVNITATKGYFEDFYLKYKSNSIPDQQLETWTWGGNWQPVIPLWIGQEYFGIYSPDASEAVAMTGGYLSTSGDLTVSIGAGQTSYLASPEISGKDIANFSMSMCHVTFWGTTYTYQHNRAKAIIVGIMTDPTDLTTFVPVDTCEVWGYKQFTYFDVDLASYTGEGRYVAFVSNFQDNDNWFALDKVTIEVKPAIAAVCAKDIKVIPAITEAQLSWPAVAGATGYKVKYLAMEGKGKKVPLSEQYMTGAVTTQTATNSITLTGLTARTKYVYTVQVVGADTLGAWSQPREMYTSAEMTVPKKYEFEELEGRYQMEDGDATEYFARDWCVFSNDADAPYLATSNYRSGTMCLYLVKDQYNDAWTVAPMVEDVRQVEVTLYARLGATSYNGSNIILGVMEDPSDLNTFTPVATFTPSNTFYERFYANFLNYQGNGKYIAMLWGESGTAKNSIYVDDLTIRPLASCFAPVLAVEELTPSNAKFSWVKNDETEVYNIKVSDHALTEDELPDITGNSLLKEFYHVSQDSLVLDSLDYNTNYFIYVQTVCSASDSSDWVSTNIKTDCPVKMALPYATSFEKEATGTIPGCWIKPTWTTTTSTYPSVSSSYHHGETGGQSLYMYSYTTYGSTIALPEFDADLLNVKLRFWAYYSSAGYKVMAGVMNDPNDPADFYPTDTFTTVASTWVLCEATFTAEDLKHGKYLAISTFTGAANYLYIDDVEVVNLMDAAPFNYKKQDAGTDWFEVSWSGKTSDKWDVIVSTVGYQLADTINPADTIPAEKIIANTQTATNSYKVESGLTSLTWYYVYAKSSAGSEWSMDSIQTECTTWNPRVKMVQGFETDAQGNDIRSTTSSMSTTTTYKNYFKNAIYPECWTVGNVLDGTDVTKQTSSGYIPYICTDGTAASANPTTTYAEKASTTTQYSTDGVNSLKVYSYRTTSATTNRAPAWAAMNKLECSDEDLKSLILTFDYQMATTAAYALIVGIMDDPTDLSTFYVLDSIPGSKGTGTGTHKHASVEIALDKYEGTGRYIAFRGRYGNTTTFYLDNVSVSLASCPNPAPSISQVTDSSAVLASGLRVDNGWQYILTDTMYQPSVLDGGTMPDAKHIIAQDSLIDEYGDAAPKMTRIKGLKGNTEYYAYLSTLCAENEISAWKMTSFTTLCDPADAATWEGNFENDTTTYGYGVECWTIGSLTPGVADSYKPYVVSTTRKEIMEDPAAAKIYNKSTGAVTGAKVLRMYAYGTATSVTSAGSYAISQAIKPAAGKTLQDYQIMFKGFGTGGQSSYTTSATNKHNLRVGITTDPSDLSKITILDTISLPTNTQQCVVELSNYQGDGKYIVFLLEKEDVNYSYAFIYDIHLDLIPACKVPSGLQVDTLGDTLFKASWNGNSAAYNVAVSSKLYTDAQKAAGYLVNDSVIAKDGIVKKTTTEASISFDGLKPNTVYYFYVQGICGANDTTIWAYESPMIHTECPHEGYPAPFKDNFDASTATGTGNMPDCWGGIQFAKDTIGTTQSYPYVYTTTSYAYSTPYSLYMYSYLSSTTSATATNTKSVAIAPFVQGDLNEYNVSFYARQSSTTATTYGKSLWIGYVTNETLAKNHIDSIFVPLAAVEVSGTAHSYYSLDLSALNAAIPAGARIALKADWEDQEGLTATSRYANFYVDNFRLGLPVTCFAPKEISIDNIGLNTAVVNFTPSDTLPGTWEILLTNTKTKATQTFKTDKSSYELTNLTPATAYTVQIRKDCDGDYSDYADAVTFNTLWTIDMYKWSFKLNEQGTVSVPNKKGAAVATYAMHPALTPTASQGTLNYSSNTTYLPYQIMNTTSLAYDADKRDFVAGGDTARALRLYRYFSTTAAYGDSAAVIMPCIVKPQGKQLSMDLRFGWAYASNHSTATLQDVVSSTYPKGILCIGTVDSLQTNLSTYKEITRVYPHPMTANDTLHEASNYGWMHYVLPLDMNLTGKQLVLMIQSPVSSYICIDNLAVEAAAGITTPVITSVGAGDTYATLKWTGNAESYNIYVVDTTKWARASFDKHIPYMQDAPACVDTIKNVTGSTYKITGLNAGGQTYAFYVEDAAKMGVAGALSNRVITTTVCQAIDASNGYSYDFEPGPKTKIDTNPSKSTADGFTFQWPTSTTAGDTVYKTPECWTIGMTYGSYDPTSTTYKSYQPTMRSNSMTAAAASQYRYARSGYSCMSFPCSSTTYMEGYAVMPLLSGFDMDTMEVNFWGRCTYEKVQGGTIYTTSYLAGTAYSTKLIVGTMTDPNDASTFVALDTVEYDYTASDMSTSTVASSDPTGNRYWLNFTVPLKGATGQYIAFRQHDHGYFYMDDLTIQKRQTARRPANLNVLETGATTATVAWKGMEEGGSYVIELSESATNWESPQRDTVTAQTYQFTGLEVAKGYFFRVKQIGSVYGNTEYAHYVAFTTECEALNPNGYKTGFECDDETDPYNTIPGATGTNVNTMKQNQCWTYLNLGTTQTVNSSYFPYNIANTASSGYSHSGGRALKLNQYTSTAGATTYRMCVVSPEIDAEIGVEGKGFDTLQISFWACPSYHGVGTNTYKDQIASASGTTYAKYIEIGTCTDPADVSTYTVLKGWTYEVEGDNLPAKTKADATNDYAFRKVTVKLNNATGKYVFIRPSVDRGDGKTFTYSTMYIDDLQFETLKNCDPATELDAPSVSTRKATVTWTAEAMSYDVQVSTDPTFTDDAKLLVDTANLDTTAFTVEGLAPATSYYFRVKSYCDEARLDASDWTSAANFRTPYAPLFDEKFTTTAYQTEWKTYTGYANTIFAGSALTANTLASTYNSWYRVQNLAMSGYALRMLLGYAASANPTYPINSTYQSETYYQKYWLVSPSITIEKENAQLTFDAALTNYTTADPITVHSHWNEGWDDQFMVIISEDDGATWKRENATVWNNETTDNTEDEHYKYGIGDYVLTDIPATATQMAIDLNKYAGKTIRIAFYAESSYQNAMNAIHVDNVHINYLTKLTDQLTLCQFEDVEDVMGFNVNGDIVPAGEMNLRRSVLSHENGVNDSLFVLDVDYLEAPQYYYDITICAGTPFEYMGFNQHTAPGTYRMKLTSQVTGCDSIVNFTIRHTEALRTVIDTTICQGDFIDFGGKKIGEAGTYLDTLQACELYGGCDSIVTLNLGIRMTDHITIPASILHGESYKWYDYEFFESVVKDTVFTNQAGCDSTITLNLTVKYADVDYEEAAICAGETYTWREKAFSVAGTYYDTVVVVDQADKIYGLILTVNQPTAYEFAASICQGDYYDFGGKKLNETGTYVDTLQSMFGCDSVVTLRLTVHQPENQELNVAICHGSSYIFGDKELDQAGTYFDTIVDAHGCEAVVTLNLTINEPLKGTQESQFCGETYTYQGVAYTEGTYEVWIKNEQGCDSVVTLVLTKTNDVYEEYEVTLCAGETYSDEYFTVNKPGVYHSETTEAGGCTTYRTLTFANYPSELTVDTTIYVKDLPYTYLTLYYGESTAPGVYTDIIETTGEGGCDLKITHILHVDENQGIDNVFGDGNKFIKVIYKDNLYILRNDGWYNAEGKKVADPREYSR